MSDEGPKKRLELLSSHLPKDAESRKEKKPKSRRSELPADWSDVTAELENVRKLARTPKSDTTGYIRHKQAGKLWVRERLDLLLDPGSFREVGSAAGTATWAKPDGPKRSVVEEEKESVVDFTPSNNVQGVLCFVLYHIRYADIHTRVW
jgi:acetyl-CoA carboxylase carboxyltransferase component